VDEQNSTPISSNPSDYQRAVRIKDDEVLLLKTELDEKARRVRRLQQQLDLLLSEGNALKERLFLRLDDLYPSVRGVDSTVAVRQWKEALWYVAMDCRPEEKDHHP